MEGVEVDSHCLKEFSWVGGSVSFPKHQADFRRLRMDGRVSGESAFAKAGKSFSAVHRRMHESFER